jgi:hypothetical protein
VSPAAGAVLNAVSCTAAAACTAAGFSIPSAGKDRALVERWNGRHWALQPSPAASSFGSELTAVSCATARSCSAVGSYDTATGAFVLLAEAWNGVRWKLAATANPSPAFDSTLSGISCSSQSACTAVGSYEALTNVNVTLAMTTAG